MNESFEDRLRRALRPVDAPAGFAERVRAALPTRPTPVSVTVLATRRAPGRSLHRFLMPGALAASLVVAVLLGQRVAVQRVIAQEQAEGLAASRQLMQALRLTSQKLDIAYEAVNKPRPDRAQENRT